MSANITETQSFVRMPELDTSARLCCTCDSDGLFAEVRRRGRGEVSGLWSSSSVGAQALHAGAVTAPEKQRFGADGRRCEGGREGAFGAPLHREEEA